MSKWIYLLLLICLPFFFFEVEAKVCRKGIPCGNTCIAAWKTCHVGRGSAVHISEISKQSSSPKVQQVRALPMAANPGIGGKKLPAANKVRKITFRSYGSDFFLCDTSDGKILKCSGWCSDLINAKRGLKLEFFEGDKIVEFQSYSGRPISCQINGCTEIQR